MKKRLFTAMLAAVLALSSLAGCSAGKKEDGTAAGQAGGVRRTAVPGKGRSLRQAEAFP